MHTDEVSLRWIPGKRLLVKQRSRIWMRLVTILLFVLLCKSLLLSNDVVVELEVASGIGHKSYREVGAATEKPRLNYPQDENANEGRTKHDCIVATEVGPCVNIGVNHVDIEAS